jgi:small subunit ribosomal protein S22
MVLVREPTGVLRKASHEEHEKMLQVYFPKEGKPNYVPSMFQSANLEVI